MILCDKIFADFNFSEQCRKYHISLWRCPSFLFLVMGILTMVSMIGTHILAIRYDNPFIAVLSVSLVAIIIFTIGNIIIHAVESVNSASHMKTEFISIASHQLRAPLASILWSLNILEKKGGNASIRKKYIELLQENNQRMIKLVNTLLDVSRIEQGILDFHPMVVNLEKIVRRTIKELAPLAIASNIKINFTVLNNIPNLFVDENKIQIVIQNLINNAIKYTKGKGAVKITLRNYEDKIIFSVTDNGIGIPEYQQKKVFSKFFRSDNVMKHQTEGSGLGLYISKAIVEANSGKIYFESIQGEETTFWVELPKTQQRAGRL